jgi:preprotein translocase subunit SecG
MNQGFLIIVMTCIAVVIVVVFFRPRVNAMANQAMGAGVEKCGPNSRLDFLNIGTAVLVPS